MYDELVAPCCDLIENSKLYEAYVKYKDYSMELAHKYLQQKVGKLWKKTKIKVT